MCHYKVAISPKVMVALMVFSRTITFLQCSDNNRAALVLHAFPKLVEYIIYHRSFDQVWEGRMWRCGGM